MNLPFDILDYILSFLKPHPTSLIAFSNAHPDFSRIAERHRFYSIIIHTGLSEFTHSFEPSSFIKLVSETPQIVNYARVLIIEFRDNLLDQMPLYLEVIASILPMFPLLECIRLGPTNTHLHNILWRENPPPNFRTPIKK